MGYLYSLLHGFLNLEIMQQINKILFMLIPILNLFKSIEPFNPNIGQHAARVWDWNKYINLSMRHCRAIIKLKRWLFLKNNLSITTFYPNIYAID